MTTGDVSGAYSSEINTAANKYGVPASLVKAVATQESGLGNGSQNVMQVNGMDSSSPQASIDAGTKMLADLWKRTGGNVEETLAAYNMGPGVLDYMARNGISDVKEGMKDYQVYQQSHGYSDGYGDADYIDHISRYL